MGTKLTSKVAAMAALIATMTVVGCGEKESQPYRQASETDVTEMAENDHLDAPYIQCRFGLRVCCKTSCLRSPSSQYALSCRLR